MLLLRTIEISNTLREGERERERERRGENEKVIQRGVTLIAILLDSVAPLVNTTSRESAPIKSATCYTL